MRVLWTFLLALFLFSKAQAAENKVLELDGNGSYVELPQDIFTNLTEATIEVWAKWDTFRTFSRIFEFGASWNSMSIFNQERYPDVRFNVYPRYAKEDRSLLFNIRANALLKTNEWIHLAALSGPGGMKLYANGILVGEHTNTASFADIRVTQTNLFGRGPTKNRATRTSAAKWMKCAFGITGGPKRKSAKTCTNGSREKKLDWRDFGTRRWHRERFVAECLSRQINGPSPSSGGRPPSRRPAPLCGAAPTRTAGRGVRSRNRASQCAVARPGPRRLVDRRSAHVIGGLAHLVGIAAEAQRVGDAAGASPDPGPGTAAGSH